MIEEIQPVQDPIVETPPVVEVAPPVVEEKVFEFQPTDEFDRPIGGLQRFTYKTDEELREKMKKQNVELNRQLRKLNRDIRLGTTVEETIPDNVERYTEDYKIVPTPLTAEERLQLVQDMQDPEKFDGAQARLVAASVGDPAKIIQRLNETGEQNAILLAEKEIQFFLQSTPEYYKCEENKQTLCDYMVKNKLRPKKDNFTYAFQTLKDAGLLLEPPTPPPAVVIPPPAVVPEAIIPPVAEVPRPQARPTASGLTRSNSSDTGPAPKKGYTEAEMNRMSSKEYYDKVTKPEFEARKVASRA